MILIRWYYLVSKLLSVKLDFVFLGLEINDIYFQLDANNIFSFNLTNVPLKKERNKKKN